MGKSIAASLVGRIGFALGIAIAALAAASASAFATGDANNESCSAFPTLEASPGFRSSLPDCRAYELVTPPYKAGQPAFGLESGQPPFVSLDGSRMVGLDFGGFAGTGTLEDKSNEFGALYEFERTASGWRTESLEPPTSVAPRAAFIFASSDLSRSLWQLVLGSEGEEVALEPERARALAVREVTSSGVQFRRLGPADSPNAANQTNYVIRGASSDLSHVLFTINGEPGALWPGDTTLEGDKSLYEYGPGDAEPVLVGVKSEGKLDGAPQVNDGAELVGDCGTFLGSGFAGRGTTYNAVSTDGSSVYFTARECGEEEAGLGPEVDELYARIGGERTVDISEPTVAQCAECDVPATAALGRRPALFEGASSDGTRAFFLSTQELLPAGPEAKEPAIKESLGLESLYEYDSLAPEGHRLRLVSPDVSGVSRVSDDGAEVYFVGRDVLAAVSDSSLPGSQQVPTDEASNLYAYDTASHATAFVASLSESDERVWAHGDSERPVEVTPDGQYAVFMSAAQLTADDTSTVGQIFEYDDSSHTLVRVSVGEKSAAYPDGLNNDGNTGLSEDAPSLLRTPQYSASDTPTNNGSSLFVSESGMVAFTSGDVLTLGASPARTLEVGDFVQNVYEYRGGNVYLISAGDEAAPLRTDVSRLLGVDESGVDLFFFSSDRLVPQAVDSQADWYDAREGGGFAGPGSNAGCAPEACEGPLSAAPGLPVAGGSETATSGEDISPSLGGVVVKPPPTSRAVLLARALKVCAKKAKSKRAACRRVAEKRYGRAPKRAAKKGSKR